MGSSTTSGKRLSKAPRVLDVKRRPHEPKTHEDDENDDSDDDDDDDDDRMEDDQHAHAHRGERLR